MSLWKTVRSSSLRNLEIIAVRLSARADNWPGHHHRKNPWMIRRCQPHDFEQLWTIINDGARAYAGVIPPDRLRNPYMSREELEHEINDGVVFWGYEDAGILTGVM